MSYFPLFIELESRPCLLVGGGRVALRKAEKLLPYGPRLTAVSPSFHPDFDALPLKRLERPFAPGDVEGCTLVIAATGDPLLNHAVSALCREKNIPVNVVDDRDACSFLFPCLVQDGPLSVGISTGGASPTAAIWLKEEIQALLPQSFGDILLRLEELRPAMKEAVPEEGRRAALFSALFRRCLELGRPMTEGEYQRWKEEMGL